MIDHAARKRLNDQSPWPIPPADYVPPVEAVETLPPVTYYLPEDENLGDC